MSKNKKKTGKKKDWFGKGLSTSFWDSMLDDESRIEEEANEIENYSDCEDIEKVYDESVKKRYCNNSSEEKNWADDLKEDIDSKKSKHRFFNSDVSASVVEATVVEATVVDKMSSELENVTIIPTKAITSKDIEQEIIKDRSLRIARDFISKEKLILVENDIYWFNGIYYRRLPERELQNVIFQRYDTELSRGNSLAVLSNAAKLVAFCIEKHLDEFPQYPNLVVFENGTLELDTKRFRRHSYNDYVNSALGIRYNPNRMDMPITKMFLETIANGDTDLYELMLQVIGYILSNDTKAKAFFYLEGVGNAGKSRFCDLVASFFPTSGPNKVARIALQDLGGKFSLGNIVNAKLNISEDLPNKPLSATTISKIKMLSDGNRQEAEAKYLQKFCFKPTCKFLFASNHPLKLKEYDQAFVNRVVYIPFLYAVPREKQDRNILEKMQNELPALFNHALAAYKRLVASGYAWAGAEKFRPRIEIANVGIIANKIAELREFVDKYCSFQEDYITATSDLQEAYFDFCQKYNCKPILGDRFSRELMEVLPETVERIKIGNQRRGFKGIKVLKKYQPSNFQEYDDN